MKLNGKAVIGLGMAVSILFLVVACATVLAPNYDKAIDDGLSSSNQKMMELFASTSAGTKKATFGERRDSYNNIIGVLDALAIQARSRPTPNNEITKKVNEALEKRGIDILENEDAPSATAIDKISASIVKMRDTDEKQGLTSIEVKAFKGSVTIYLDQAITYESHLER